MFLNDFEQNAKAKSANCKELTRDIYGPRQMSDRARTVNIHWQEKEQEFEGGPHNLITYDSLGTLHIRLILITKNSEFDCCR